MNCFQDITERKQAQEALRGSETRFRQVAENISEVFWLSNPEATLIHYVSPAYETIWGRSCNSLYAEPSSWMDSIHPDDRERVAEGVRLQLVGGRHDHTYRIVRPDGSLRWIRDRAFPVSDESGKLIRVAGIAEDITERKEAEERLREYEKVVEGLEEMIVVVDRNYRYLLANRAFLKYRGMEREQLVGRLVAEVLNEGVFENVTKRKLDECLQGKPVQYEMTYRYPDRGERDLLISYFPIEGPAGVDRVACVLQDITERNRAAKELEEANHRLRILSRRLFEVQEQERRHLARELHDEIGQALTAAKINLQSVESDSGGANFARLQETTAILDRLLGQVRQISLDLRPSMLDDLGLVPALRSLLDEQGRRASVEVRFSAKNIPEKLDPEIKTTCFRTAQEAITNAVRHAHATDIDVDLQSENGKFRLLVRDNGVGFDVGLAQAQIAGLGLIGIKERAALVGGQAKIASTPDKGTTIEVSLPLTFRPRGQGRHIEQ
jgi:PAS domain S-box-containing protein